MTTTQSHSTTPDVTTPTRSRGLVVTGLVAAVAAALGATIAAALARAAGADFELPDGGEAIPLTGFAFVTFVFSVVGIAIAAGVRHWSEQPAATFVRVAVVLTAVSLVPPFLVDASLATSLGLVLVHLVAAAIAIPMLARKIGG